MTEERKLCGKFISWWDGEYEGECELPEGHTGRFHYDGLSWYDDDGMHDPRCQCWCHIKQPDWCPPGWSHIGGNILKSCGCMTNLFDVIDKFFQTKTESVPITQQILHQEEKDVASTHWGSGDRDRAGSGDDGRREGHGE